jgi:hypothetical protein
VPATEARHASLDLHQVESYLASRFGRSARVLGLTVLGQDAATLDVKGFGYGVPVKVDYEVDGRRRSAVLETITPGPFGHEYMADRAQILLWSHRAFNRLPRHARSLDVGGFAVDGALVSLGDVEELFILNEFVPGTGYQRDLERLRDGGQLTARDIARCDVLCDYLAGIHRVRGPDPTLYARRVRELVGHPECIMGILDSYPDTFEEVSASTLEAIEHAAVNWRWRLKGRTYRLRQVHGDFHPWNILFQDDGTAFVVLDRSRGEWGEPADDVTALTINYLFFSLLRSGSLDGAFAELFARFWRRYLAATGDEELLAVAGVFFAFRGLVVASPVWYPTLPAGVRTRLLTFVRAVLEHAIFDPARVNEYCTR